MRTSNVSLLLFGYDCDMSSDRHSIGKTRKGDLGGFGIAALG